jgi:hypothetical protein
MSITDLLIIIVPNIPMLVLLIKVLREHVKLFPKQDSLNYIPQRE